MFVVWLLVGLALLVVGGEFLVRGAGRLALGLRIPALVVGLTVVAMGTSMPELMVSLAAAMSGSTEMALANVNGSNIANVALVLGAAGLVRPMTVERSLLRREVPACLLLQILLPLTCLDGTLGRVEGLLFVLFGGVYNVWLVREAMRGASATAPEDLPALDGSPWYVNLGLAAFGVGVLVVGADLFVEGASEVARTLGLSERFIGLTVVAVGTSAPELATGLVSAWRGEGDLAVGNSLGSNLFNICLVLGITAMVQPIQLHDAGVWTDFAAAFAATAVLFPLARAGRIGRAEGSALVLAYAAFVVAGLL